ncbi:esterase/lipase family protein [Georgenia sp. MJ170]|uniref:esterase/lipase family protein n=1 Tax=Georgenia sunbinii TaxID=3117728 RepID=UPI002F266719
MTAAATAWWWLLDYAWAVTGLLRGVLRRTPPARYDDGDDALPTVVLIPGVYERWAFLAPLADALNDRGHRILTVPALGANRLPVLGGARHVREAVDTDRAHRYVLVGHSKGGLIGKAVLTEDDDGGEVLGLVALATPFSGSRYARFLPGRTLRGLSPRDATIRALTDRADVNGRVVSLLPDFDPHVPGERALEGATIVRLPDAGHFRTVGRPATADAVARAIAALSAPPSASG